LEGGSRGKKGKKGRDENSGGRVGGGDVREGWGGEEWERWGGELDKRGKRGGEGGEC